MAISPLSTGCMEMIMTGGDCEKPVLQILGTKKISGGDNERYRLLVSDGKYLNSFAMLATQLNDLYKEGNLVEYTIIRVDRYITSMVNKSDKVDKRVLIILELTVLNHGAEVGKKIGNPVQFTGEATIANKPAPAPAAPPKLASESTYSSKTTNGNSYNSSSNNNYNSTSMNQSMNPSMTAPIASLTPYQNKWVIKARVTSKSGIRTWSNAKGEGKLFNMDLLDESGEIRATAFKEQCDRYYDMIEVDKVYFFSKCQLKPANKQYSSLKNDYEMTFTGETLVQPCEEEDDGIPQVQYNLVPISQIANIEPKAAVDTIGICRDVGELNTFTSRANKEFKKRELTLVDISNAAVQLTLWGDDAEKFETGSQHVILVKGARVSEFGGGKSLSMGAGSVMKINPDIPEGHRLRGWFDNGGGANISTSVSTRTGGGSYNADWVSFYEARAKNLGSGEKPDYFQCKAVVRLIRSTNSTYKACPQPECNKKVIDENNGHYRCEKCNAMFPDFKYRLLINMEVGDWTSSRWVTCFSDLGEQLLGKTSKEIGEALENDPQEAEQIFSSINFHEFVFRLRSKVETYGDTPRNKLTVMAASPINHKEYNKYLINSLKELTGIGKND
ncbi:replication protein A 70 kDa DNA-binding subunit [Episyrphus balteatus]|uniref:replication protein A 70 kDa DNA-binding subunit n=1 Tax=Episyrphus balteatus TaxID=286459 RepID=UPI002484E74E|nr:replication protein A 70 kDa DNA-binding subunit [Episyrphus balteatus]